MTVNTTVLVTAAGTVVAQGIIKSLRYANSARGRRVVYRIVTADMSAQAAGLYRGDLGVVVPSASSKDYLDSISEVCKKEEISAVFVGSDEELSILAGSARRIEKETGATVMTNSKDVIATGRDKWKTFEFLKKNGLPCAESALPGRRRGFIREFGLPVVVKPREGHGSLQLFVANSSEEVDRAVESIEGSGGRPVLQQYLKEEDEEFTSGVMSDRRGRVISSISMRRRLKGGQTYKAFVGDFPEVRKSAEKVAVAMGSRGPLNIQARVSEDEPKIFEINPRFSASCPIRAVAGINEPDILFRSWILGEEIRVKGYRSIASFRYWNEVYVKQSTFDKTLREGRTSRKDSFIPDYF
ncbi:MAG: ATP-grasp domain-containing protein [Nitrososphaerales archaeon]